MQCHVSLNACHTQLFVILCIPSAYCGNNSMSTHYTLLEYDLHANPIEPWKLPQGQGATRARNPSTLLDPVLLLRCFSRFRRRRRTIQEVQPQSTVRFYQQLLKIQAGRRLVSRPGNRKFPKVRHSKWVKPKEENIRKQHNGKMRQVCPPPLTASDTCQESHHQVDTQEPSSPDTSAVHTNAS